MSGVCLDLITKINTVFMTFNVETIRYQVENALREILENLRESSFFTDSSMTTHIDVSIVKNLKGFIKRKFEIELSPVTRERIERTDLDKVVRYSPTPRKHPSTTANTTSTGAQPTPATTEKAAATATTTLSAISPHHVETTLEGGNGTNTRKGGKRQATDVVQETKTTNPCCRFIQHHFDATVPLCPASCTFNHVLPTTKPGWASLADIVAGINLPASIDRPALLELMRKAATPKKSKK